MGVLAELKQQEPLLLGDRFEKFVLVTDTLPSTETTDVGECRFLTKSDATHKSAVIYVLRLIDGNKVWMELNHYEDGKLDAPTNLWKRIAPDAIILHWKSPDNKVDADSYKNATWDYEVIVKKHGEAPKTPYDGETVGYSAVKDQYNSDTVGFVDALDSMDKDYYYRIFAFTKCGNWTASEGIKASWTWQEIKEQITLGLHHRVFRVGDIFEMPYHYLFGTLNAQIVDFDKAEYTSGAKPTGSITFMTVEVLMNMSFDNKELRYARIFDDHFKFNKTYYVRKFNEAVKYDDSGNVVYKKDDSGNYVTDNTGNYIPDTELIPVYDLDGSPVFEEFDLAEHGLILKASIPSKYLWDTADSTEATRLYEEHPSLRYWYNTKTLGLDTVENAEYIEGLKNATALVNGCAMWTTSNLRSWLTTARPVPASDYVWTVDDDGNVTFTGYTGVNEATDEDNWTAASNGWFSAVEGAYHNVAPGSKQSATYVEYPCFQAGFQDRDFVPLLMNQANITITDLNVHRYVRNDNVNDTATSGIINAKYDSAHAGATYSQDDKFWIPSFEQIYGRKPVYGTDGQIYDSATARVHEGTQFEFFANGKNLSSLVKYDTEGNPICWYTRTCDPHTPGKVYYIPSSLPTAQTAEYTDLLCSAHRYLLGDDALRVGPAVCFTLHAGEAKTITLVDRTDSRDFTVSTGSKFPIDKYPIEEREGYRFDGWWTESGEVQYFDGDGVCQIESNVVTDDVKLVARWVKVWTLKLGVYNGEGDVLETKEYTVDDGSSLTSKIYKPEFDGYMFYGWFNRRSVDTNSQYIDNTGRYYNKNLVMTTGVSDEITSDLELFAFVVPRKISLVSDVMHVTVGEATVTMEVNEIIIGMPKNVNASGVERSGYTSVLSFKELNGVEYRYEDGNGKWTSDLYLSRAPFHTELSKTMTLKTSWK